ncbi:hypothetical protein [Tautonia marina]|uniref:hypothetical protein n=1 Tax=Tautonia marina TaxID=2653855 RepID=UPI001260F804|nr:hypothetical protein [Tautonia marina]
MTPPRFHFRGYPEFLAAAAEHAGRPDLAGPAGRVEALAALAVLCSQAVEADRDRATAILQQAAEFRHQLKISFDAADAMLRAVATACGADSIIATPQDPSRQSSGKRSRRRKPSPDSTPHEAP